MPVPGLGTGIPPGRVVDASAVKFIEPGKTTREDVLLRLGSPESATAGEDQFVYDSVAFAGFRMFLVPLCTPGGGKDFTIYTRKQRTRVEILFDADSRVRSVSVHEEHVK